MSGQEPPSSSPPAFVGPTADTEEATAASIHGIIVSAAVMAAAHQDSALATVLAVLVTLIIYWTAERYARIVAERIHEGHRPNWATIRVQVTRGWEMVTASVLPLIVLVVARLVGADLQSAILWALSCSTVLLCIAGWNVGRHGRLTRREQIVSTAVAGIFGIGVILMKALLH